ncbi:Cystathionine beta-lyase [Phycisphaerae bacterium RAS1]|nr:Cystathionine beta-lyase [Phycisphaerae bacterium RAS1]
MKFATQAIHIGQDADPTTGATVPPIYATSTYTQSSPGQHKGFEYSRTHNPTRNNLEACLAALECGVAGASFASGLAGTNAIVAALLRPGESLVAYSDLYGGTYRMFERAFKPWGLETRYTDRTDPVVIAGLIDKTTRVVWIETPTNPMLNLLDIAAIAKRVREAEKRLGLPGPNAVAPGTPPGPGLPPPRPEGITFVVDNTFASPALQQPIALGADLVLHSTTKYIGGHSDVVGGAVVAARSETMGPIRFLQNAIGGVSGPFDCFLTHRGLKTLAIRMKTHSENALRVARWAAEQKEFERVIYPGLPNHPSHELAKRQTPAGFGGIVTCVLKGGLAAASKFMSSTKLFSCAESLGGVESLVNHPAIMTHASIPREIRERIGVVDGLIRLSVGIEDCDDLIADLDAARKAVAAL